MTFGKVLICVIGLVVLASCIDTGCAGWRKVMLRPASVDWLAKITRALEEMKSDTRRSVTPPSAGVRVEI